MSNDTGVLNVKDSAQMLRDTYASCHESLHAANSHLKGMLLTLADASFSDPQQRKAFKDLLSQQLERAFHSETREILVFTFRQVGLITGEEIFPEGSVEGSLLGLR